MSILIENHYNFTLDKYFAHHSTSIAKPVRTNVDIKFDIKNLGSSDASDKLIDVHYFVVKAVEDLEKEKSKNGTDTNISGLLEKAETFSTENFIEEITPIH